MTSWQNWGSNVLGQAQSHAAIAAKVVTKNAGKVKSSLQDNLSSIAGTVHTFDNTSTGGPQSVTEIRFLAEGGFGAVVLTRDSQGKNYALKKINCADVDSQMAMSVETATREAKILLDMPAHPGIIRCFGVATDRSANGGAVVKLLLELCSGGHLLDYMDSKNGRLSARELLEPMTQISEAVRHMHSQTPSIQHRDLKVENVLLEPASGQWKLCDFGSCSTECVPAVELSRTQKWKLQEEIDKSVTMLYRPPEMADISLNVRNGYVINEQVDLWMLGCILFTLAFYQHPFQDTGGGSVNCAYFIPKDHPMAKSAKLCGLIHWLLAIQPSDRPTSQRLCEILHTIQKTSYPDLLSFMPPAVQEKIQKLQVLYATKGDDSDVVTGSDAKLAAAIRAAQAKANGGDAALATSNGGASPPALERNKARLATAPASAPLERRQARLATAPASAPASAPAQSPARVAEPVVATLQLDSGFDLCSALAPSEPESFQPAPVSRKSCPAVQANGVDLADFNPSFSAPPAPAQQSAPMGGDLLGFDPAPTSPAAPSPVLSGDLLGFTAAPAAPPAVMSGPAQTADAGWANFADFTSSPAPQQAPMPAAPPPIGGGDFWASDFADFTAAPAPQAVQTPARLAAAAPAPATMNLLDF